jgi:hypothetical protein
MKWGHKMDNRNNEHILKALEIANDLMCLANNEVGLADEGSCGILSGVMRDCAYKIRRHAKHAALKTGINGGSSASPILIVCAAAALSVLFALPVKATTVILSTDNTETLGGLTFGKDSLVEYTPGTDTATLYFDGGLFGGPSDIDAAHVLDNDNIILSTAAGATLGGLTFGKGDLVEYNPTTDTAALFFDEVLFSGPANIDAAYIRDNGNIILSTTGNAMLGGLSFGKDDLIEYNPAIDAATLFLDGNLFSGNEDIDAVHLLGNGNIVLSTTGAATLGGLSFGAGDLAEYNPTTSTATLYFDGSNFASSANIDAVHLTSLPEPATIFLLGFGCMVLVRRSHS